MGEASNRALTADERAAALGARVDAARAEVADLTRQMQEAADRAHAARVAADFDAAGAGDADTEALRNRLAVAASALSGLETAQQVIAEERRVEQHRAALAVAEGERDEALLLAEEHRARIWPAIKAAQDTLADALAYERQAQDAAGRAHDLQVALGAPATRHSSPTPVMAHLVRHPFWQMLQTVNHGD